MPVFDPQSDFSDVADGLQAVTVLRAGGSQRVAIPHALRRAVHTSDVSASQGRGTAADVRWHLPTAECGEAPGLGDWIVDASGNRWLVLEVAQCALSSRWACVCRNMEIAHRLDDTITVERAEYGKGPGGAAAATWRAWRTGVRARIQPVAVARHTEQRAESSLKTYRILLADDLPLDHTHRIRAADGSAYTITGYGHAQRLGEPHWIEAVQP